VPCDAEFERALVDRYTQRLLDLARRELPDVIRRRLDPEDVVQSVYRSFFHRLKEGRFTFGDHDDIWRLLAAMTYQKAREAGKFHGRLRRSAWRDRSLSSDGAPTGSVEPESLEPGPDDLAMLMECLDRLVARLPDKYREIVVLRLNGEPIERIAASVGRSTRTVFRGLADIERLAVQLMR